MALTMAHATQIADRNGETVKGYAFTGTMRDFDFSGLVEGDEFTVPKTYEVREQKMGISPRTGKEIVTEYIFVETSSGTKRFYPSMFSKIILVYEKTEPNQPLKVARDANGVAITRHHEGTAVDLFRSKMPDVNAGVQALANSGKKVKIVKATPVLTRAFGREVLTNANIYQIDLV